ncbi:outer membrane efflux protein [Leptothrix cholodnii SP-6]|uniref:Outer membrane efflux protein n=1 Tax=Leptothrix cholodnii (strain ATCC 51168 / LMG 8142 / SP-6) TaxID=395495 RepID=B1Y443_LEPCP|nr:TolC family protein [Leptothrix cholodnii]ACB34565.1 outer membrane efflux protein [Leptothrix cholodnii SP-6]
MNQNRTRPPMRTHMATLCTAVLQIGLMHDATAQAARTEAATDLAQAAPPRTAATEQSAYGEQQAQWLLKMLEAPPQASQNAALALLRQRVLAVVLEHPESRAAGASLRGAQASTREARSAKRPQLELDAETGYRHSDPSTLTQNPQRRHETGSVGLTLRQSVYDFGANDAAIAASEEFAAGVAARADGRRGDLALRAVQATLDLLRARQLLDLARINLQAREEMVRYLNSRYELGGGTVSDVWRAQSRLADARGALAQAQARERSNAAIYRELFAHAPDDTLDLALPPPQDTRALMSAPLQSVQDFAALRGAAAALRTAEQELEATRRRDKPRVNLELGAQRRDLIGRGSPGTDWQASLVLRHSFYSGGGDDARVDQAQARINEADEQLRNTRLQLERALLQALNDDAVGTELLAARRDAVRLAVDALRGVREQFANRRGSLLDLLNAQDVLHGAGLEWVDAQLGQALAKWRVAYFSAALLPWLGLEPQSAHAHADAGPPPSAHVSPSLAAGSR